MNRALARLLGNALALLVAGPAAAEVVARSSSGFLVRHQVMVDLPPLQAYRTLTDLHRWWNPAHTWSGDAAHLRLEARVGGCWCERWIENGQTVDIEHMRIRAARPGALLRATGGLGPLQELSVSGTLSWTLEAGDAGQSIVTMEYTVSGWTPDGLDAWAEPVDFVLGEQSQRYARLINTGHADAP